jgi:heptosyltransferase-2
VRTLVVLPKWVGDTVMALPVLEALAKSGRHVVALAKSPLHALLRLSPHVHELVERDADDATTIASIARAGCDEAVLLQASVRAAWLPKKAGIAPRWGYGGTLRGANLLRPPLPHVGRFLSWAATAPVRSALVDRAVRTPDTRRRPQIEDFRELLAAMGVPEPPSWVPRLELGEEELARGRERLQRARIAPEDGPLVALFPGAEFGPAKRWPWRRFADLAQALRRDIPGCRVFITAGPSEVWLAVRVHEESGHVPPVVGPDLDLAGLAGVLAYCDALVTNDSGPMHLAAALDVPCIALFGPTDERRTAPAGDHHRVLAQSLWCRPCLRRSCPLLHHHCMKDTSVATVLDACRETLAATGAIAVR